MYHVTSGLNSSRMNADGRRTTTWKPTLLIALPDLCARYGDVGGQAPRMLLPGAGRRGGAAAD